MTCPKCGAIMSLQYSGEDFWMCPECGETVPVMKTYREGIPWGKEE